ncbi:MAG: endonuclease III [Polyangiaceae bacterium]
MPATSKKAPATAKAKPARAPAARAKKAGVTAGQRAAALGSATATFAKLRAMHPDAHCELDHVGAFQLLVATVLSAQTTDKLVNKVTPHLFAKYPDARTLGAAEASDVAELLGSNGLGMYNQKAKNIVGLSRRLVEKHKGEVPRSLAELVELPGVGRKTANVVLGVAFGAPEGVVVDTHVQRISQRLGWTKNTEPPEIEQDLCKLFPRSDWDMLSHTLIFHGRRARRSSRRASCDVRIPARARFTQRNIMQAAPRAHLTRNQPAARKRETSVSAAL